MSVNPNFPSLGLNRERGQSYRANQANEDKTHFMNIVASPDCVLAALMISMIFSTAFQYFQSPVR